MNNLIRRISHNYENYNNSGIVIQYTDRALYAIVNRDASITPLLDAITKEVHNCGSAREYAKWLNDAIGRAKLLVKYPEKLNEEIGKVDIEKYQQFINETADTETLLSPIKLKDKRINKYHKAKMELVYKATGTKNKKEYELYKNRRKTLEEYAKLGGRKKAYEVESAHRKEDEQMMAQIHASLRQMNILNEDEYRWLETCTLP